MYSFIIKLRRQSYINKLISRGLVLGKNVYLNDGFFLDPAHCHLITIEDNVVFGPSVSLFAHDASALKIISKTLIAPVHISKDVFIGARSIILPGVTIGRGSIIGAGAVVSKNVPEGEVWAGVPAIKISTIEAYRENLLKKQGEDFSYSEYKQANLNQEKRNKQISSLKKFGLGFMKD